MLMKMFLCTSHTIDREAYCDRQCHDAVGRLSVGHICELWPYYYYYITMVTCYVIQHKIHNS